MNDVPLIEDWSRLSAVLAPFLIRCAAAAVCGAMVGLERELRRKPAGLRTNILICVGSCIYMIVGLLLTNSTQTNADPGRIAAQVVTGIGFLGAGCIIQAGMRVTGLTSAATIWVVAAIGLVAGAGFPLLAFVAALMVLVTLALLRPVEERFLESTSDDYRDADAR